MKNMATQMELFEPVERGFEEGGLMDEGGTVDPVSGNEVPPGSTKEEVRDDVPAQLSEGEFVFPADVVRYIGLEKLMRMRQEAKMGLAAMEAMGQMGNSEEAVMPDNLPFDMYDLDIEEEDEYNMARGGVVKMQQGGTTYTPPTIGGFTPPPPVTTGVSGPQPVQPFQSGQGQFQVAGAAEGAVTPKTSIQGVTPTFSDFVGMNVPGVDFKMVTFYDENGQAKVLKQFSDGSYEDPTNPGVKVSPTDMGLTQEMKTEVTPTEQRVQTAQVRDDSGRDDAGGYQGATVALGGTSGTGVEEGLRVGEFDVVGVSYNMPNVGLGALPGLPGFAAKAASFATSGLPERTKNIDPGQPGYNPGGTANFFDRNNPNASVTVTAEDFNNMKNTDFKGALAESYKSAVRAVSAVKAGDIEAYNNLSTDRLGPSGKSAKDLADAATIQGLMDKVDIDNPRGIVDNLKNLGTGTFKEAVDKLNDAEKAVLEGMGVDLDLETITDLPDDFVPSRPSAVFDDDDPSDFDDDDTGDSAPSAPSAPSGPSFDDSSLGKGGGGGGSSDSGLGPSSDTDRGDTGRNTAR